MNKYRYGLTDQHHLLTCGSPGSPELSRINDSDSLGYVEPPTLLISGALGIGMGVLTEAATL